MYMYQHVHYSEVPLCIYIYIYMCGRLSEKGTLCAKHFFATWQNSLIGHKTGQSFSLSYNINDYSPFPTFSVNLRHGDHHK